MNADVLKYRIFLKGYVIGMYHPTTSLTCLIRMDGYHVGFHELFHSYQVRLSQLQELYLMAYADQFLKRHSETAKRIKDYVDLVEAHASALVSLSPEGRMLEEGILRILEKQIGGKLSPRESGYVNDLKEISQRICPESPFEVCQAIGMVLIWSEKYGKPSWKEALDWLKRSNHIDRIIRQLYDKLTQTELTTGLIMALSWELHDQGFDTLHKFLYFTNAHSVIERAYNLFHYFLNLFYVTHEDANLLVPILPTMVNLLFHTKGEGLNPLCYVDLANNEVFSFIPPPSSAPYITMAKRFQEEKTQKGCHVAQILADFFGGISGLDGQDIKPYYFSFCEAMAKLEDLFLASTIKCKDCVSLLSGLVEGIRKQKGDERLVSKSKNKLSRVINNYEQWFREYALLKGGELILSSGLVSSAWHDK